MRRRHVCAGEEKRILRKSAFWPRDVTGKRILGADSHGKAHSTTPGLTKLRFLVRRWSRMRFLVSPRSRGECRVCLSVRCAVVDRRGDKECTQIGENGLSAPFWGICVHCCDASRVGWNEGLDRHGAPAASPRWPPPLWSGKQALRERRRR